MTKSAVKMRKFNKRESSSRVAKNSSCGHCSGVWYVACSNYIMTYIEVIKLSLSLRITDARNPFQNLL